MAKSAKVVIRPALESDLDQVHSMMVVHVAYQRLQNPVDHKRFRRDSGLCPDQPVPYFYLYVAETEDKTLVGYALYVFHYKTTSGRILYLQDLHVTQGLRGTGVGFKLVQAMARLTRQHECLMMKLHVLDWNQSAIDFYHKCGFKWNGIAFNTRLEYDMDLLTVDKLCDST